ncbi:TPA: prepilin peptidase [Salmonella enterica subsp. salamae serovar 35:g,m,s,t:-]|nr:prepilin peptidase [Salmonella enterica subsp. salamae serovar 35:g,m,s,t:-]HCA3549669.1 prepilin peptidase [Salmonella enterica subsp. salamae serovar 35:g,m,s,t:-]
MTWFVCSFLFLLAAFILPALFIRANNGNEIPFSLAIGGVIAWLICMTIYHLHPGALSADLFLVAACFCLAMSVLDASNHWLPLEFTFSFSLLGIIAQWIIAETFSPEPLLRFAGMFALLASVRWLMNQRYGRETFGMGDVWLISGMAIWLNFLDATVILAAGLAVHIIYWLAVKPFRSTHSEAFPLAPVTCLVFIGITLFQ